MFAGIYIDFFYGLLAGSVLLLFLRRAWGHIYSDDPAIDHLIYQTLPIMFVYLAVDSPKCITLNVLRSTGRPLITVLGNIIGLYLYFINLSILNNIILVNSLCSVYSAVGMVPRDSMFIGVGGVMGCDEWRLACGHSPLLADADLHRLAGAGECRQAEELIGHDGNFRDYRTSSSY